MSGKPTPFEQDSISENERLTFALDAAGVGTWDYDLITGNSQWSVVCKQLFGLAADAQVTGSILLQQVHADDRERVDRANKTALNPASDIKHHVIFRTLHPNEAIRWIEAKGKTIRNSQNQIIRFSGIVQDVTEAIVAKQQFEHVQRQVLDSFEQAPVAIAVIKDPELTFTMANHFYGQLVGRNPDELIGKPLLSALPELVGQGFDLLLREVIRTGTPYLAEEVVVDLVRFGKPETIYVDMTYQPMLALNGELGGVLVVASDVTQQVLSRQKIEESEARFRSLVEEAPVATCLFVGPDLIIDVANEAMINVWGKGLSVIGKPLAEALPELKDQHFLPLLDNLFTTGETYAAKAGRADLYVDGLLQTYYFDYTFKPLRHLDGSVYAILETAVDVSQEVKTRQKLAQSEMQYRMLSAELEVKVQQRTEELEAANEELASINEELLVSNEELVGSTDLLRRSNDNLQQFAYIASHDLQEPLRKIQQFSGLLSEQYGEALGEGVDYLQRMHMAASRMSTLIRDLLAFSRISIWQDSQGAVSLNEVINLVISDLDMVIQETGAVLDVGHLPTVVGDASQLGQLFQNLISNALKFRKPDHSPVIKIRSSLVTASQLPESIKPARQASAYHQLVVSDNGIGFDQKYAGRIFQVFQRLHSKAKYAGTGIGLSICDKVAVNHGGVITADGRPGQGATFRLYLPI
ncbi:PAS domain-containing sensor histidine kinase [Fibrella aquatica]|uniref:PAS domain-containing sensor histidine kinase n=1 Tax=Fibrella aquatica TaxID=3242487 RepID=UPI00351FE1A2